MSQNTLSTVDKDAFLDAVKFNADGWVCAIAQDADTGEVLQQAWMNREALELTLGTGKAHYYSRSRRKLWLKGETSGHTQTLTELRVDCDGDTVLMKVRQQGAACHEGYYSCFFRVASPQGLTIDSERVFDPESVYGRT